MSLPAPRTDSAIVAGSKAKTKPAEGPLMDRWAVEDNVLLLKVLPDYIATAVGHASVLAVNLISAKDLAFSVVRFFSKNDTLINYYMYHGGTNFGRTTFSFVTTHYYDEAPLNEYGFQKEPKWGHLRDLHSALRLCRKALLWGLPTIHTMGKDLEALVYEKPGTSVCAAFLTNNDTRVAATATFRGVEFYLPSRSISILPDCKTIVFNTQRVTSHHNARGYHPVKESDSGNNIL
ncbi:beta-galactosidase 13-like [Magnolia sinica]|uniref:beta-galactosidase 13-like n=1 Tax=Magnolia sinica TaxID=86752 RepID=UPI002657B66B|nr:beta-galactosidase 13-like [Magnolia sinica]